MPSGKTFDMLAFTRQMNWRMIEERPARDRDRSLPGKDRIRARKAANKTATV
jgi:hypothetical protein